MSFIEQLPEWQNTGSEPPASKKTDGWGVEEKPPADWFNWLHYKTYKALEELQQKALECQDNKIYTSTGTNDISITVNKNFEYVDGITILFSPTNANTGPMTININSLGAKALKKENNIDLYANDVQVKKFYLAYYDQSLDCFIIPDLYINTNDESRVKLTNFNSIFTIGTGKDEQGQDIDVSSSVLEGQADLTLEGKTATNLVENGDFSNGTNGWDGRDSTLSVSNNVMTCTSNGNYYRSDFYQTTPLKISNNSKFFIRVQLRVTNSECTQLRIVAYDTGSGTEKTLAQPSPTSNQYYNLYYIADFSGINPIGNLSIYIQHEYPDYTTANGKIMEVKEVFALDLTAHGLENKTADEINEMFPHWFDGTKSTLCAERIKSIKNVIQIDENYWEIGTLDINSGQPVSSTSRIRTTDYYSVEGGKTYKITKNSQFRIAIREYNDSDTQLKDSGWLYNTLDYTFLENTTKIKVILSYPDDRNIYPSEVYNAKPQVYKLDNESISYVYATDENGNIIELHSLPNGTKDEVKVVNNEYVVEKNTKDYVIQDNDFESLATHLTNVDLVIFRKTTTLINYIDYENLNRDATNMLLHGFTPLRNSSIDDTGSVWKYYKNTDNWIIIVPKGYYTSLEEAKQDLAGTEVIYQLATPKYYEVNITPIQAFEKGTMYIEPGFKNKFTYTDKIEFSHPVNQIDKVEIFEEGNWVEISNTITLASDGLSATIEGILTNTELQVYGMYKETIPPTTIHEVGINLKSQIKGLQQSTTKMQEELTNITSDVEEVKEELFSKINQAVLNVNYPSIVEHFNSKITSPVDVSMEGKMVVNLAPPFNSDAWHHEPVTTVNSPNKITINGVIAFQSSTIDIFVNNSTTYTFRCYVVGGDGTQETEGYIHIYQYDNNDNLIDSNVLVGNAAYGNDILYSFTTQPNTTKITLHCVNRVAGVYTFENLQFLEGSYTKETIPPYSQSAQPLQNPYVKLVGENLFDYKNISQYTTSDIILNGDYIEITGGLVDTGVMFKVKPNTNYTLSCYCHIANGTGDGGFLISNIDKTENLATLYSRSDVVDKHRQYTFNSGNYTTLILRKWVGNGADIVRMKNVQLEEGTTATDYEPYKESLAIIPTYLAEIPNTSYKDKLLRIEGTKAIIERQVKKLKLDGNFDYNFSTNYSGYKRIKLINVGDNSLDSYIGLCKKYNGNIILAGGWGNYESWGIDNTVPHILITTSNTDTGWGDSYTPTSDEIKAYMMGWQMNDGTFGTPYNGTGTKTWIPLGDTDNTRAVTTCPTEPSPTILDDTIDYYELYYALVEPYIEEIELDIPFSSDGLYTVEGTNTVEVGSGLVWEKANPMLLNDSYYIINSTDPTISDSKLTYKTKNIPIVFKNGVIDNRWGYESVPSSYGNYDVYLSKNEFEQDQQAEYYVLYEMLDEEYNNKLANAQILYEENLRESHNALVKHVGEVEGDISELFINVIQLADKELGMHMVELLTTETTTDLKNKINEILNVWR